MGLNKILIISSFIILIPSYLIYNELTVYEYFKTVNKINSSKSQKCKIYPSDYPIETFIQLTDELIVGGSTNYNLRYHNFKYLDHNYEKGSLILLNRTSEKLTNVEIENFPKNVPISPDGMDYYNGKLYVINHAFLEGERIEVLKVSLNPFKLTYEKAFKFDEKYFGKFNSISVVNDDILYVSEWLTIPWPLNKNISKFKLFLYKYIDLIKRALKLRLCVLNKYDMKKNTIEKIINSNGMANNGIAYDRENRLLYLAQTFDRNIKVFQLDEKGDVTKFIKDLPTGYGIDNLYFNKKSKLLFAAIIGSLKVNFDYGNPSKGITRDQVYGGILVYDFKKSDKPIYTFLQNDFMCEITHGMIIENSIYLSSYNDVGILKCEKMN